MNAATGARLQITGPASVGTDGLLTAQFTVDACDPAAVIAFFRKFLPYEDETLETVENVFALLSGPGGTISNLALNINRGEVRLGPVKLGEIPPLTRF